MHSKSLKCFQFQIQSQPIKSQSRVNQVDLHKLGKQRIWGQENDKIYNDKYIWPNQRNKKQGFSDRKFQSDTQCAPES